MSEKATEYRFIRIAFGDFFSSLASEDRLENPVTLVVQEITGYRKDKEILSEAQVIVVSVTNIGNDKRQDGMLTITGLQSVTDQRFSLQLFRNKNGDRCHGILRIPYNG